MDTAHGKIEKILVTGGCGQIGSHFMQANAGRYAFRVVDRVGWDADRRGAVPGEVIVSDLQDIAACRQACQGMDAVVHLAANPDPAADWASLLPNNIVATYNMFTAAQDAGCRRFLFASSVHALIGYPQGVVVTPDMPIWPITLYGVTKCFGEALGVYFAYSRGLPTIALRIGAYQHPRPDFPLQARYLPAFVHPDDLNQLLGKCLETPGIQFAIVHATSNNSFKRMDLSATIRAFGYQPQADAFEIF